MHSIDNKIFQQAQARVEQQRQRHEQPALDRELFGTDLPGRTAGTEIWADIVKRGKVIGRQKIVVPPDEVEHLASLGCSHKEIAEYFGVNDNTLRYHFSAELTKGSHNLKTKLRQAQLRVALEGNAVMLIWLGKNILGQSDSGLGSDTNKVLPWSDSDTDDNIIEGESVSLAVPDLEAALADGEYANTNP